MKSMTLADLTSSSIPTVRLIESDGTLTAEADSLTPNVFNLVTPVDINNSPDNAEDDIRLEIQANITDLRDGEYRVSISLSITDGSQ